MIKKIKFFCYTILNTYYKIWFNSRKYWEKRYKKWWNSWAGSYNKYAEYKANILNDIIDEKNINSLIEFGCWDWNNLNYYKINYYTGFDISETAIKICISKYREDSSKSFILYNPIFFKSWGLKAELTISFEVIFHLIEDNVFLKYFEDLFNTSSKYVLILSSNNDHNKWSAAHYKNREFTKFIPENFSLIDCKKTPQEWNFKWFTSDFYLYIKNI
jgi:hypothetical protein